jgi:hypothetical protein
VGSGVLVAGGGVKLGVDVGCEGSVRNRGVTVVGDRLGSRVGVGVLDGDENSVTEAVGGKVGEAVPVGLGEDVWEAVAVGVRLGTGVADGLTVEVRPGVGDTTSLFTTVGLGGMDVGCEPDCPLKGVTVGTGVCSRTVSVETLWATSVGERSLSSQYSCTNPRPTAEKLRLRRSAL